VNRYILAPAAKADLIQIRDFLVQKSNRWVAARVLRELRDGMERLAGTPGMGHLRLDLVNEALRFYSVYKYLIIYRAALQPLQIVRVLHGARDVRSILDEPG
jgi:toxin ParE1/3/4